MDHRLKHQGPRRVTAQRGHAIVAAAARAVLETLEPRRLFTDRLIPVPNRTDLIFDAIHNQLDIPTSDGKLQPARSGIGLTVIKSTAPVVPVRVFGTFEAYNRYARFPRPRSVAVKFGEPMSFEDLRAEAKVCSKERLKQIYQQVADEIMDTIAKLEPSAE